MKFLFKKKLIKNNINKKIILLNTIIFSLVLFLLSIKYASAANVDVAVATVVGWILWPIFLFIGKFSTWVTGFLVNVAQYSDFIGAAPVVAGWVVVRDLCNMFFILILLVVAFATILRIESYQWKKILPKLLIMAVLINFSKTICGLIIDFAQVIMLTFVNGFAGSAGNFIDLFGMRHYASLSVSGDKVETGTDAISTTAGIISALIFATIALIVLIVLLAVLVMRIVMLWIYIILSPIAFLAAAFPAGQKYASQWWGEFSKNVIVGPVLAFFIWLALSTISGVKIITSSNYSTSCAQGLTSILCDQTFTTFIVGIGFLIGGLMVTQQMGGIAASIAGKGMDWAKKSALAPLAGAKVLGGYGIDKLHEKTGVDLNVARVWSGIQEKRKDIQAKRYGRGMIKASEAMRDGGRLHGALAMTGTPGAAWEQLTTTAGWRRRFRGGISGKKKIDDLAEERKESREAIEKIETSEEYKNAEKISKTILPSERRALEKEQPKLTIEIKDLDAEIKSLTDKIKKAKSDSDSIGEKEATDKLNEQTKLRNSKLSAFTENKEKLNTKEYNVFDILKAKKLKENLDAQVQDYKKNIEVNNDEILKYKPIMDFDAIAMQGSLENEEMKKIDHVKDREELASMLRDAIKNKDRTRFDAVALKLTKDGNENDGVLNNMGYSSNADGLNKMVEAISTKGDKNYMKYSKQEAMALGMKISYAAEANNHWGTARAFTMEDGRYRNSSAKEQAMAAISEIAKMDPQGISRSLNRLGYGGETPDGKFVLNEFGLALLKTIGPSVAQQMNRFNPNALARLSTPDNVKLMVEVGIAPEFIAGLTSNMDDKGRPKSQTMKAPDVVNEIFKV